MSNHIAIILCAAALGALPSCVFAQSPVQRGRVLILRENEKTWTGDIELIADEYRVKRLVGETRVPVASVLKLCASLEEAHLFMQGGANLDDPDERLRLARWCWDHNLREQALAESKAALALKPDSKEALRLSAYLEKAKGAEPPKAVAPERPAARVDVTAESLATFSTKVQPILMNACVGCHNSGRGGSFQLTRTSGGMRDRRSMDANLAAAVAEFNAADPATSRLLLKAVSLHAPGMTQAPIRDRQSPAYQAMQAWVKATLDSNPQLRQQAVAAAPPARWGDLSQPDAPARGIPQPDAPAKGGTGGPPVPTAPQEPPGPADPDAFNREFHPGRADAVPPPKGGVN